MAVWTAKRGRGQGGFFLSKKGRFFTGETEVCVVYEGLFGKTGGAGGKIIIFEVGIAETFKLVLDFGLRMGFGGRWGFYFGN